MADREKPEGAEREFQESVRASLRTLPGEYEAVAAAVRRMQAALQSAVADALAPAFNAQRQRMPHHAYEDKRRLASWANRELRDLGLCMRCPETGAAAILLADYCSDRARESRFRIEATDATTGRRRKTYSSSELPTLALRRAPLEKDREEPGRDGGLRGR